MPDLYPYITENQSLGFNEIASYVNTVTNGVFFPLILLAMFVIIFVVTMGLGTGRAFTFATFFSSIIAIFMVVGNLLNPMFMYLLFVLLGIGLIILRLSKSSPLPQI